VVAGGGALSGGHVGKENVPLQFSAEFQAGVAAAEAQLHKAEQQLLKERISRLRERNKKDLLALQQLNLANMRLGLPPPILFFPRS